MIIGVPKEIKNNKFCVGLHFFVLDGIAHYCVTNMPGAVARTSTYALTNASFTYILVLANLGFDQLFNKLYKLYSTLSNLNESLTNQEVY